MGDPIDDLITSSRERVAARDHDAARLAAGKDELVGVLRDLYERFVRSLVAAGRTDQRATIMTLESAEQRYKTGPLWRRSTGSVPVKRPVDLEEGWVVAGGPRVDFRTYERAIDTDGGGTSNWHESFRVFADSGRVVVAVEGSPRGDPHGYADEAADANASYRGPLRLLSLRDIPLDFVRVAYDVPRVAGDPDPALGALQSKIEQTVNLLDARLKHLGIDWASASR